MEGVFILDEKIKDILDKYDVPVTSIMRGRGAWICITDKGRYLLKIYPYSENHLIYEAMLKSLIVERGYPWIDSIIYNKEGQIRTEAKDGHYYILKQWFDGRECDPKSTEHIQMAVKNMASLHRLMKNMRFECARMKYACHPPADQWMLKRYQEMKMIYSYIRHKKKITPFEQIYIAHYTHYMQQAADALNCLKTAHYDNLYQIAVEEHVFCHGAYSQHNVIIYKNGLATVNFDQAVMNTQIDDLYYFMRKILEKNEWDIAIGSQMLQSYTQIHPLSSDEKIYLYSLFLFPEKFWKIANRYFNMRKSWVSGINMEKMQQVIRRENKRQLFLDELWKKRYSQL